jgi:hypothetical protein
MRSKNTHPTWPALLVGALLLAGCGAMKPPPDVTLTRYDAEIEYAVTPTAPGFTLLVYMKRTFVLSWPAFADICVWRVQTIAKELAQQQGRLIHPIDAAQVERTVKSHFPQDASTCTAQATAVWQ